ncbi:hypothetical protein ALC57_09545, partial [Trachymyrmex cornetzi]
AEIKLSTVFAEHNVAFLMIDHLMQLGRTKCINIVKYVLAPEILRKTINYLKHAKFSILVDESTDISLKKSLCLFIRYVTAANKVNTKKVQISGQKDLFDKFVSNIETDNIREQNELSLLSFNNVLDILDKKELHLPNQWAYIKYVNGNIKFLIFFLPKYNLINDHENKYTFNAVKEVVLTENMKLEVTVLKQFIIYILPDMQIHNTIENIEQLKESHRALTLSNSLKESLFSVDNFNICLGAINIANDIEHLGYNLAFKDICNTWRHNKCLLLIPQSSKTCKFCLNIKSSLNKKKAYKSSQSS